MKTLISILACSMLFIVLLQAQDTIQVETGWNLIGAKSTLPQNQIRSYPNGIIASSYYGYKSGIGYSQAETLKNGKGFWVKATQEGILLWGPKPVSPCLGTPTVIFAGKTYNTVQIGTQCWLKENLDIGTMIVGTLDQTDNSTLEKYCFNDDTLNCNIYGGMYQWKEVMQYTTTEGVQGICPLGWHIPTITELQTLTTSVSDDANQLKAIGQGSDAGAGTNLTGFSALLSGGRSTNGSFTYLDTYGYFWSSTQSSNPYAQYLTLSYNDNSTYYDSYGIKAWGLSVRCIKD